MTGEFKNEALGFDVENVDVPLVGDAVLDQVEGAPEGGQKIEGAVPGDQGAVPAGQADTFTAESFLAITTGVVNIPCLIWNEIPTIDELEIQNLNNEFHRYCIRKGIDPWTYLFDEMGLVMAAIPIAAIHWKNYKELVREPKREAKKNKLDGDYEHYKEVEDKKEAKINGE